MKTHATCTEGSSVPPPELVVDIQNTKVSSKAKSYAEGVLSKGLTAFKPRTIGGKVDQLFETPIISTIIATYSHLGKEGSKESQSLHQVLIYKEEEAIRLRHEEIKTELATLDSITFKQIKNYQRYLRFSEITDVTNLFKNIKHLDLSDSNINNMQLRSLFPACSKLTSLNLKNCPKITDYGLRPFAKCPLTSLNVAACDHLTNDSIKLFGKCPLELLNVSECSRLSDEGLIPLADCPLRVLHVGDCDQLTDEGLKPLANRHLLTSLNVEGCFMLSNNAIRPFAACPLRLLNVRNCFKLTDDAIIPFMEHRDLTFHVDGCYLMSDPRLFMLDF